MARRYAISPGHRPARRLALVRLAGAAALLLPRAPALARDWTLEALMRLLRQRRSGRARFHETRTLAMLNAPIESSGVLRFAAPDFLEMRTLHPRPQSVVVRGSQVTLELDGRSRVFALDEQPEVAALVDGIRATLDGDLAALQRAYTTRLRGTPRVWSLELVPRLPAARARIREIDIGGSQATVRSIAIYQADGDHSLMMLHELAAP